MIKRVMALWIIFTMLIARATFAVRFKDVQSNDWAYETIQKVTNQRMVQGYPDGTFKPNNQVVIAEFTTMLARSYNIDDEILKDGSFANNVSKFIKEIIAMQVTKIKSLLVNKLLLLLLVRQMYAYLSFSHPKFKI